MAMRSANRWGKLVALGVGNPRAPGWGKLVALGGESWWPHLGNARGPTLGKAPGPGWGILLARYKRDRYEISQTYLSARKLLKTCKETWKTPLVIPQ